MVYHWSRVAEFVGRERELERLERWWTETTREPLSLYGRRRVGKSWLFHRFADGKPAEILVASQLAVPDQLRRFAEQLAPRFGDVVPAIHDVGELVRLLYRAAREEPLLAVIDEFPYLLGGTEAERTSTLSRIQAVMEEERDTSGLKLILCGSLVAEMEALSGEKNPLHGRLQPLELVPMDLRQARQLLAIPDPVDAFTRYAIAGGMPRYLAGLAGGSLADALAREVLSPHAPLWSEGQAIVAQELRSPATYNSILSALASGDKEVGEIASLVGTKSTTVHKYLTQLAALRLVNADLPFGAAPTARGQLWSLLDPFLRFWFRFVLPFHEALDAGLSPQTHVDEEIAPVLGAHVSPVFEDVCRRHVLAGSYGVSKVGRWWGNARNDLRASGERSSEEIDIVASRRGQVTLVGECKWTTKAMGLDVLQDLRAFKIPALRQSGLRVAEDVNVVLFSKEGFSNALITAGAEDDRIHLVDVEAVLVG